jgi:tetratricopeptide (TPR) repeat protein
VGAYLRRARTEDAVKVVEAILGSDPSDRFALLTLGEYHLGRNNTEEAERLFDRLLVATKAPSALAARIAGLWYDAGHRRHAIRYYELALQEESPPATLLNNLAWTYAEEELSLERARELSLRAVKEEADNVVFLDTYAEVLYRQGRTKQAAALLRRAVELEPEDGEHRNYLLQQLKKFSAASGFVVPGPPTSTE